MRVKNIALELIKKIDDMLSQGLLENKKIYIWGVSKASYISAQYILKNGYNVESILDNDANLWGAVSEQLSNYAERYKNLMVQSPDILKISDEKTIVLVFSRAYNAIREQALGYGVKQENCIHVYSPNAFLNLDDFSGKKEITVEERKNLQYEILKYLKDICIKNGLRYYLAAGTLLGAVRHKGYIPWDDDIDVYMPWKDYKKLIALFKTGKEKSDRYSLLYYGVVDNFSWIYVKIQDNRTVTRGIRFPLVCDIGVNIDIFPMGGIPSDTSRLNELKQMVSDFQKNWANHLLTFTNESETTNIANQIERIMSKYEFDESPFVGYFINGYWNWEMHHYSAYEKSIELLFEDDYFMAPVGYDEVLTHSYGDYLQYPPNWQTLQYPHTYRAFWK